MWVFCLFSYLTLATSYFLSTYIGPYSHPKCIHFYNLVYNLSYIIYAHIILFNHINTHIHLNIIGTTSGEGVIALQEEVNIIYAFPLQLLIEILSS